MAALAPFRALRPTPSSAARVAAVPYDVVTRSEARALAANEPLSFLHVSRAEIDLAEGVNPYGDEVYARAAANLAALATDAPLVKEEQPSLYIYRLRMNEHQQTGIAGCFALADYEADAIRKHERTRREKEDDRTRHILTLRAQTGPAFLTFPAREDIRSVRRQTTDRFALFDFTSPDGIRHTVWRCNAAETAALIDLFAEIPALYIADGHHRAAAAARARRQLRGERGASGEWDTFLAVAFPDNEVQVLPYNRVVRDLGALTPGRLLDALRERFDVRPGPPIPVRRGDVSMFLDGQWHTVRLGVGPEPLAPDARLDVSRLQQEILAPMLGIADVTTDQRIDFVGGIRGAAALEQMVRSGDAAVAFSMYPVSVDDIMQISDEGGIMPPKSSWFEPKLRDGLLVHTI
jgi:uncharacterized protein (DUF1015 family)